MKKHVLSLVPLCIVMSVAFAQCSPSTNIITESTTQMDTNLSEKSTEPKSPEVIAPLEASNLINDTMPLAKPKSIAKTFPKIKSIPHKKTIPTEKLDSIDNTNPIDKETIASKPIPVVDVVSLKSSGFTLKLLKASIKGTSTLHDWESQVTEIEGKGKFQLKDKSLVSITDAEIKIAVKGIKSTEGDKMDNKTYHCCPTKIINKTNLDYIYQ